MRRRNMSPRDREKQEELARSMANRTCNIFPNQIEKQVDLEESDRFVVEKRKRGRPKKP